MTKRKVAIYARVSKPERKKPAKPNANPPKRQAKDQDPENQLVQLRAWCKQGGYEIVQEYVEREGGLKGTEKRKALLAMLSDAHQRQFDLVLFWSLDRFSREGMNKTVSYLQRLNAAGVAFHSYTEEWLSTDNELVRDILIAVMASLAKQEAIKISERTKAGLARARAKGKALGRRPTPAAKLKAISAARAKDPSTSINALAKRHKVARTVVRLALAESE